MGKQSPEPYNAEAAKAASADAADENFPEPQCAAVNV